VFENSILFLYLPNDRNILISRWNTWKLLRTRRRRSFVA